jgi:hypothetical protein
MTSVVMPNASSIGSNGGVTPSSNPPTSFDLGGRMWRVYSDAMDESGSLMKGIFKLMGVGSFWIKHFNPQAPKACGKLSDVAKNAKNITSVIEWPIRIEKLKKSVVAFDSTSPLKSLANIGSEICSVVNNGSDTAEFVHTLNPLPAQVMEKVKVANSAATFFGSLKGSVDTINKLASNASDLSQVDNNPASATHKQVTRQKIYSKITSNLMSLSAKVCYLALGALGLASLAVAVPPVLFMGLLTVGTCLSLTNLFYDRIVDPNDDRAKKLAQNPLFNSAVALRIST